MCAAPAAEAKVVGLRLNASQGTRPRRKTGIAVTVCRCRQCGLHYPKPLPVPAAHADHYGVPPESYWNQAYFSPDPHYFERQIDDAKRLLGFTAGMKALDVGVGIGKAVVALRDAQFDVWGIEPSDAFHSKALEFTRLPRDRLTLVGIEGANFPPRHFDFITFGAVLEHLYDPADAIRRAMYWLRPGGVIQIEVPSSNHLIAKLLNLYFRAIGTTFVTNLSPMHSPFHIFEFTLDSFIFHGKAAGYEVAEHYFDVCTISHVPGFLKPMFRRWMDRHDSGMQLTVWLRKRGA